MKTNLLVVVMMAFGIFGMAGCAANADDQDDEQRPENVQQVSSALMTKQQCQVQMISGGYSWCVYWANTGACECHK